MKIVNPPDTSAVDAVFAHRGDRAFRPASTYPLGDDFVDDFSGNPFRSATRARSAGAKAISPRIARS